MRRRSSIGRLGVLLVLGAAGIAAPAVAAAAGPPAGDTSPVVATWAGGGISVNEMLTWWGYGTSSDRKALTTLEEKEGFLNTVIDAKLMIEKAESLGITQLPTVADFSRGRRVNLTNEAVFSRGTAGRINVTESDVDEVYRRRLTEMELSQIIVPRRELAAAIAESLAAGADFKVLAGRHSVAPTANAGGLIGTVRWGDFTEDFSAQAFRLESGQVSAPFQVPGGWCILRMDSSVLKDPADPAAERKNIRARLERDAAIRERSSYLDSLKTAYDFQVDIKASVTLSAKYAIAIDKAGQSDATVLDADIIPDLSDVERAVPLVTFRGGSITTGEIADLIAGTPFQVRPRLDDPDDLIPFVTTKAQDSLVYAEGVALGFADAPEVDAQVERARRRRTLSTFYSFVTRDVSVDEAAARAAYEANADAYTVADGWTISKIVVGTMEAADSVLARLEAGEAFEQIARTRSRDPFTATQGGDVGFLRLGQDKEFDGFLATMQPGERKAFRSLEGVVILWLREKHARRQASFEEARASVEAPLLERLKDEVVAKWAADRRAQLGVAIDRDALARVVLK